MWRADQHGPALGPQPTWHSGLRHGALRTLAATDRSRRARDHGMLATMSIEAATSGAVFLAYLDQVLLPELRRTKADAVLVLDNLRAHKTAAVRRLLDRSGFLYRYLPAYSPDLSPIEPAWAKLKAELRRIAARSAEALHQALRPALDTITAQDAAGFFRHAGYSRPN